MKRLVVVGNGTAGVACVEHILKPDPKFDITLFGDEMHVNYNRILLSRERISPHAGPETNPRHATRPALRGQTRVVEPRLTEITAVRLERAGAHA
jgi:NADPH-dependent 2,4-dienoyl-CoA reductase/sulfur reductase-like enzyme